MASSEASEKIRRVLGLENYDIDHLSITQKFNKPTRVEITLSRELTPEEAVEIHKITEGMWNG